MFAQFSDYQKANPSLWQGRNDESGARFFQSIHFLADEKELLHSEKKLILLGFASDEGVKRNQGRTGAQEGPDAIKQQLAKLPLHRKIALIDLGNIQCEQGNLEESQRQFAQILSFCHQQGHRTIALGGGHEIAWAHYQGLKEHYPRLGVLNFDAHFDLRPYKAHQQGTSGTPFSQIALDCEQHNQPFYYACLGVQETGNTAALFQRAKEKNVFWLSAQELYEKPLEWQQQQINTWLKKVDHIYLTICLDVLAECFAPGVSAPQPLGINPWQLLSLLKYVIQSGKVISLDVAELAPPLDVNQKTARLAAQIIAELLHLI